MPLTIYEERISVYRLASSCLLSTLSLLMIIKSVDEFAADSQDVCFWIPAAIACVGVAAVTGLRRSIIYRRESQVVEIHTYIYIIPIKRMQIPTGGGNSVRATYDLDRHLDGSHMYVIHLTESENNNKVIVGVKKNSTAANEMCVIINKRIFECIA